MKLFSGVLLLALTSAGLVAGPALAASKPAQVELVMVVGASQNSLTLDWQPAAGATSYQVELATNMDMTDRHLVATADGSTTRISGLRAGQTYCFQVRGMSGRTAGLRSARTCKPTIREQGSALGSTVRLLTYNLCVKPCGNWTTRRGPAIDLITSSNPDVISLQETARRPGVHGRMRGAYDLAYRKGGKMLLYRTDRFTLKRAGYLDLGVNPSGSRHFWAVWAELADRDNGGDRAIFTSVHVAAGPDNAAVDAIRAANTRRLISGIQAKNRDNVPVVYAGDFNSHKHRDFDSPATVFHAAGYWDSYDLAESLVRPNFNSANQMRLVPTIGTMFGDHVDHFWVDPRRSQVLEWKNAARVVDGQYDNPLPSNHNPVFAKVVLN